MLVVELQSKGITQLVLFCVRLFPWACEVICVVLTFPLLRVLGCMDIAQSVMYSSADGHWMLPLVGCSVCSCCGHSWMCLLLTKNGSKMNDLTLYL